MKIIDLKHSHPKIYESAMKQKTSYATEDFIVSRAFDWQTSKEGCAFWQAVYQMDFETARGICPHLFRKFNVGDRVNVPLNNHEIVTKYNGDLKGVIHGYDKSVDNIFTVHSYEDDLVLVEYVGKNDNKIVRLGWKEEQLSLYIPKVKEEEQNLTHSSEILTFSEIIIPDIVKRKKTPLDVKINSLPEINVKLKSTRRQVEKIIIQIPELSID